MSEYVVLEPRRNRGWPSPEASYGLTPMFGEDGWCHSCGVPKHPQTGSLTLQRKGLAKATGAWMPNWIFDTYCLDQAIAEEVRGRFRVDLRPVAWAGKDQHGAEVQQIVVPTVGPAWFDQDELRERVIARHGTAGATCAGCGIWRWLPLPFESWPPLRIDLSSAESDVAASPEWFGDGWKAFRHVLFRRELAELIAKASPRDFVVKVPTWR
jgi:hypothetical protein